MTRGGREGGKGCSQTARFVVNSPAMSEIIFQITEDETEGGFVAQALGHSIVTQAETWEELRERVRAAVRCHFEEGAAPAVIRLHRVLDELLPVT